MPKTIAHRQLSELASGDEADFFALLTAKETLTTRDGKPYFRVTFRDSAREVSFPIWNDAPWSVECRDSWTPGEFYKLRATYRETNYGPQLEIRKIRPVAQEDYDDGFTPSMCQARSRYEPSEMFDEMVAIAENNIPDENLSALVVELLRANREKLLVLPAAKRNHHAMVGGYLEHVLSVTKTCLYLAEKYDNYYTDMSLRLNRGLVVAGAILHDIGKLRELEALPTGADYTSSGYLIGHMLQGRDMVREAEAFARLDPETQLRLEHLIIAHQRLPEWGSPKAPMTPEALIVHYADDLDAKFHMMVAAIRDDSSEGSMTSSRNALLQRVYKGEGE